MKEDIHGAWSEYAREQDALRRRETRDRSDVTGREALDRIIDVIGQGRSPAAGEARRARLSSERRERAHDALIARYALSHEDDLRHRSGPGVETLALSVLGLRALPAQIGRVVALRVAGWDGREVALRVGLSEQAVRQCVSRASRKLSA